MLLAHEAAAAAAKSLQSCPTLCNPIDDSPPGSTVPGILQARTLEWVAISFSKAWKWKVKVKSLSRVWLLMTPWTAAHQAPPSMGFSGQQYWSGLPLPSPCEWFEKQVWLMLVDSELTGKIKETKSHWSQDHSGTVAARTVHWLLRLVAAEVVGLNSFITQIKCHCVFIYLLSHYKFFLNS